MVKKTVVFIVFAGIYLGLSFALAESQQMNSGAKFFQILSPLKPEKNWVNVSAELDKDCRFVKKTKGDLVYLFWSITQKDGSIKSEELGNDEGPYFSFDVELNEDQNTLEGTMPGLQKQGLSGKFIFHSEKGPAGCNYFTELGTTDDKGSPIQMIVQKIRPDISWARAFFTGKLDRVVVVGVGFDGRDLEFKKSVD